MNVTLVVAAIVLIGSIIAGTIGLRGALRGEFGASRKAIHRTAVLTGLAGGVSLWLTMGWPWKSDAVTALEEVIRPIEQVVDEPYEETVVTTSTPPWWKVWASPSESSETHVRHRSVTRTSEQRDLIARTTTVNRFSVWLLLPMIAVGWMCYRLVKPMVRLGWRMFG